MYLFIDPIALWLVAARFTGWMLLAPGFAEINTPRFARAALVVWFSCLMLPTIGPLHLAVPGLTDLVLLVVSEFVIGAGYGLVLRLIFSAIQFGGLLIDSELGYLYAQQVNPFTPISGGIFNRLFLLIAILYFWLFDYFRLVMEAIHQSFVLIPLGTLHRPLFDMGLILKLSSALFVGGVTFAAPIMALMFFVSITMGFLARTVQGLHLYSEIFTLKIIVGLLGVFLLLPLFFLMIQIEMEKIVPMSAQYFRFLTPE